MIMKVPARYFSPAPKVDSAIICIRNISRKLFVQSSTLDSSPQNSQERFLRISTSPLTPLLNKGEGQNIKTLEQKFWEIVRAGFAHKRKKLSSNLKKYIGPSYVKELKNKRAEELSLDDWLNLAKKTL
jgi:16S rRNA A1518/A1519 N6-dimethyltransferase RsmA/KsgA/DIM1 with predicted DNA glycosylase/AP lyase activity